MYPMEQRFHDSFTLPKELILRILAISSQASGTSHSRNICLVCRSAYIECWPSLYRIVCLRNATELKKFSEFIYPPFGRRPLAGNVVMSDIRNMGNLKSISRLQDAVSFLYLNNNRDGEGLTRLTPGEKPEMWMISILLAAANLKVFHFEEYWTISYPWETREEKPLVPYPLMLLSDFLSAFRAAFVGSPDSPWTKRMFNNGGPSARGRNLQPSEDDVDESQPTTEIYDAVMAMERLDTLRSSPPRLAVQPEEVTISALALAPSHLTLAAKDLQEESIDQQTLRKGVFENLQRLHLYFARLTTELLCAIIHLPSLTHVRLTRPFSENLLPSVVALLEKGIDVPESRAVPPLKLLVIEAGLYMDRETIQSLHEIETSTLGRQRFVFLNHRQSYASDTSRHDEDESSTSHVVQYVTSSEQRGFEDFVARAHGREGVWERNEANSVAIT